MGGIVIGLAASLMLFLNGKLVGISGILESNTLSKPSLEQAWRYAFLLGLLSGGYLVYITNKNLF